MRAGVRREMAAVAGIAALGSYLIGKKYLAAGLGVASAGLRLLEAGPEFTYRDRVVMITGGSRGFGLALAERLVCEGAHVWILARDNADLGRAHEQLRKIPGGNVNSLVTDVTKPGDLARAFSKAHRRHGRIDMLVNNAGAIAAAPFASTTPEDYEAQLRLHVSAVIFATRLILPYFREGGGGRILNISSLGGKMPLPHMSSYATSKFALAGFSASVATELARENVLVTTAYPGLMRTGSPIQAVFKGDAEAEFARFLAGDIAPLLSLPADRAAREVLTAAARGDAEVVVSAAAKAGAFFFAAFPETYMALAARATAFLPNARESSGHRTGAQSGGTLAASWFGRRLLARNDRYARRWNQAGKTDARRNLNLPPR